MPGFFGFRRSWGPFAADAMNASDRPSTNASRNAGMSGPISMKFTSVRGSIPMYASRIEKNP